MYRSVCNTNYTKTTGPIATKLGTWTKFDLVVNVGDLVSSVVVKVREGRSTKIIYVNVYHATPPGGDGSSYCTSAAEITCIFALYTSPGWEAPKPTSTKA